MPFAVSRETVDVRQASERPSAFSAVTRPTKPGQATEANGCPARPDDEDDDVLAQLARDDPVRVDEAVVDDVVQVPGRIAGGAGGPVSANAEQASPAAGGVGEPSQPRTA